MIVRVFVFQEYCNEDLNILISVLSIFFTLCNFLHIAEILSSAPFLFALSL